MKSTTPGCISLATILVFLVANGASSAPLRGGAQPSPAPAHPPTWPDSFYISFTETNMHTEGPPSGQVYFGSLNTGDLYYDYTNKRQRLDRSSGEYDEFCNTVEFGVSDPCNTYILNGVRYLVWPTRNFCCYCCTEEEGCGMLKPTWVKDAGGRYLGVYAVDYTYSDSWVIHGDQYNYWYQNATSGTPVQLVQGNHVNFYSSKSFKKGPISPSIFKLPEGGCNRNCADASPNSKCAQLQKKA